MAPSPNGASYESPGQAPSLRGAPPWVTHPPGILRPSGAEPFTRAKPTADAVGYPLPVLRTSGPAAPGPEGRKTVAHGVSRGWPRVEDPQPQRGDRTHSSRKLASI